MICNHYLFKVESHQQTAYCESAENLKDVIEIMKNSFENRKIEIIVYKNEANEWKQVKKIIREPTDPISSCPVCNSELEHDKKLNEYVCPECDYRVDE